VNETIPALVKLKEAGKTRFIGITGLPLGIFSYVLDKVPPGTIDVVLSYCHYSVNDSSLGDLVPYLKTKGVAIINASPLSMGLLTQAGPPQWHPASPQLKVCTFTLHIFPLSNTHSTLIQFTTQFSLSVFFQFNSPFQRSKDGDNFFSFSYTLIVHLHLMLNSFT